MMTAKVLDGKLVAELIQGRLKERVLQREHDKLPIPKLAVVKVGDDPASGTYVENKIRAATKLGMEAELVELPESVSQSKLRATVSEVNARTDVHGIIVQLPIPANLDESSILEEISTVKDVDGLTSRSLGRLVVGFPVHLPATPLAVVEMMKYFNIFPEGKHVVVVGRSLLVGRPISIMLSQRVADGNATVTVAHRGTQDLKKIIATADILIVATGSPNSIGPEMLSSRTTVMDVGTNWIADETRKSGRRLVGDVDFDRAVPIVEAITPVPGGIGPMTVTMLLSNTLSAAEMQDHL